MTSRTPIPLMLLAFFPLMLLAFFPLLFGGAGTESLADSGSELQQAQGYFENNNYQQAEQIYQGIIKQCSDANQALEAQKGLVMVYISLGKQAEAETAYQQLLLNFPHNTHMADVIHHGIASHYRQYKKDDKADELDKYVLSHWPTTENAMWAQVDLVRSSINGKNYAAAQTGVDNLLASFSNNEHLCDAIHSVAYRYRQAQETTKADELDQYVLDYWPSTESAMWAQVDIVRSSIDGKNYTAAQAGVDNLLARFSSNENMANVLHGMAYKYRQSQETAKADELDQYVLDHWPSTEIALWAYIDLSIKSNIDSGELEAAQAGLDKLIADFNDDANIADAVHSIANHYRWVGQSEKADQLYQYVIDTWPENKYAKLSEMDLIVSNIVLENDANVQQALDRLIADFNDYPQFLPIAISKIEERYYNKILVAETWERENYIHPVEIWEKVLSEFPDFFHNDPDLYYFIADCYRRLGYYEKAVEYYGLVATKWSDNGCAALCHVSVTMADDIVGGFEDAERLIDKLRAQFSNEPGLGGLILRIGQEYYDRAIWYQQQGLDTEAAEFYLKAIALWQILINELPSSAFRAPACHLSAASYRQLDICSGVVDCCEIILTTYPRYKFAPHVQQLMEQCQENL